MAASSVHIVGEPLDEQSVDREPAPARPVTVLYLAGAGRAGSTVLGELLDRIPDVTYVGELNLFWRRYSRRELCSCGRPLPECGFWSTVVHEAFGDLPLARAEQLASLERRVFRYQAPQVLVLSQWGIEWGGLAARELLQERSQLYQAVGKVAGSSWIVDTGKEPVFGASLTHLSPTVVDFVHVVRDPRGVAYSCKKRVRSDSEPDFMPRRPAAATAWRWLVTNLMAQIALRRLAHRYVLVRYEDLVAAPQRPACCGSPRRLVFRSPIRKQPSTTSRARPRSTIESPAIRAFANSAARCASPSTTSGEPGYQSASSEPSVRSALFSWLPTATRCERPVRGVDQPSPVDAITACAHRARSVVVTAERRAKTPAAGITDRWGRSKWPATRAVTVPLAAGWSGRGRTDGRQMRPRPDPRPNG